MNRIRLGSAEFLQDLAGSAAGRALGAADLAGPVADAADVLTHARSSRRALVARIELRPLLVGRGRGVLIARVVAHCAVPPASELSSANGCAPIYETESTLVELHRLANDLPGNVSDRGERPLAAKPG